MKKLNDQKNVLLKKISDDEKEIANTVVSERNKFCYLCDENIERKKQRCGSHLIPQMYLEPIINNYGKGQQKTINSLMVFEKQFSVIPGFSKSTSQGKSETLIFDNICIKCDSGKFKDYENSRFLKDKASIDSINEIVLKSLLWYESKTRKDKEFHSAEISLSYHFIAKAKAISRKCATMNAFIAYEDRVSELQEFIAREETGVEYVSFIDINLPYTVPLAFHTFVPVRYSIQGNHMYKDSDPMDWIDEILIVVLPGLFQSKVIGIHKSNLNSKLKKYVKDFQDSSSENQLRQIQFMMLNEIDTGVILSPLLSETIKNRHIRFIIRNTNIKNSSRFSKKIVRSIRKMPNILLPEYSIQNLSTKVEND